MTRPLIAAILLPLGAIPASAQPPQTAPLAQISGTRLDLVATGQSTRTPDVAVISAGVITEARGASEAMAANASRIAAAIAALRRAGVADRDISTASVSLQPRYRYADGQAPALTGYQASNQLSIRFREVRRAGAILDALVAEGVNQLNGPTLQVDQPQAALDEARAKAVATARARAELYARAAGLQVTRILSISEGGGFDRPMPMDAPGIVGLRAAKEDTMIEAGEQTLSVTVAASFELRPR